MARRGESKRKRSKAAKKGWRRRKHSGGKSRRRSKRARREHAFVVYHNGRRKVASRVRGDAEAHKRRLERKHPHGHSFRVVHAPSAKAAKREAR